MRRHYSLFAILAILAFAHTAANAQALKRTVPAKHQVMAMQTQAPTGRLVIKFKEESGLVVRQDGLAGGASAIRTRVHSLLAEKAGDVRLERRFGPDFARLAAMRQAGQARARMPLPDLNAYGVLDFSNLGYSRQDLLDRLKPILADPAVETAFLEPQFEPATLERPTVVDAPVIPDTDTPDFSGLQTYLGAPPLGLNALAAADIPGALGQGVKIVDVETGWNLDHEDLKELFFQTGIIVGISDENHGTAVLGELCGADNGHGVRGIVPEVWVGVAGALYTYRTIAIANGAQAVGVGDILLIEMQGALDKIDGDKLIYMPVEYWQDVFDLFLTVTAGGGIVVEAAGNGGQDLDSPAYAPLFDRNYRDSGAILCGAATPAGEPIWWSNHGSRVDLNGWGQEVTTCGYGDLYGTDVTNSYTDSFDGTSSASPMVAGAAIALQGMAKANYGYTMDALAVREVLVASGTPQLPGILVGPRPDIAAAYESLKNSMGQVSGTVVDGATGLPVPGVVVTATSTGQSAVTDAAGAYSLLAPSGLQELRFADYFHADSFAYPELSFATPTDLDLSLDLRPAVGLWAVVRSESGALPTSVRLTALDAPLVAERSPIGNRLLVPQVAVDVPVRMRFDGQPGHGVVMLDCAPAATSGGYDFVYPLLPTADLDFELWWYNLTATNGHWTWGEPTAGPAAFSGAKCWGVGMAGDYPDATSDYLTAPDANLSGHEHTYLSLHYWCDLEDGYDGVQLEVRNAIGNWNHLVPVGGYSHDVVLALGGEPGWSGASDGWQGAVFDISHLTSELVTYRFRFASDGSVHGAGFFVDDITIDHGHEVSGVPDGDVPDAPRQAALAVHPNPFNPVATIDWAIAQPGPVAVEVFDLRGRLVCVLLDEVTPAVRGTLTWAGRDATGRTLASGTYLVRVRDGSGQGDVQAVTLIK